MSAVKHNWGATGVIGPGPQGYGSSTYPREPYPAWELTPAWMRLWRKKWRKPNGSIPYSHGIVYVGPYVYATDRELARIHLEERYGEKDQGGATQARFGDDAGPYEVGRKSQAYQTAR